jgi:hypothetical protein
MATAILDFSMTSLPVPPQRTRPVLRRATYVHVSDLTSVYNIDHARLEQELSRVKAVLEAVTVPSKTAAILVGEAEVDAKGKSSEVDSSLPSSHQKRLQPPRGGFNLCV